MAKTPPRKVADILSPALAQKPPTTPSSAGTSFASAAPAAGLETSARKCPVCADRGFVVKAVPVGHPDFGRAVPCVCSAESMRQARLNRMNPLGHLNMLADMTFATFRPEGVGLPIERQRILRMAYDTARAYAEHLHGWLLLTGGYGVGKTHLAAAIAHEASDRGVETIFALAPDLLDHLRSSFGPGSDESYDELFERLKNAPLLVLDDLGAESSTPWAQEKLFQLLNHRYLQRLPTVVTSNQPMESLDPRLRSRLAHIDLVTHMHILAADYRGGGFQDRLVELSELDLHSSQTFDTFIIPSTGVEKMRRNLEKIRNIGWDFAQRPEGWLALVGRPGVGKTHLAAAIANHIRQSQPQVLFISGPTLLDHLRAAFSPHSTVTFDVRFEQVKRAPVLILDDLSAGGGSEWAREKLMQLVDFRYLTRQPTVFTIGAGGSELKEMEQAEPRIAARLNDMTICKLCYLEGSGRTRGRKMEIG